MNQFALKAQIQQQLAGLDEDGEKMVKGSGNLVICCSFSFIIFGYAFFKHTIYVCGTAESEAEER